MDPLAKVFAGFDSAVVEERKAHARTVAELAGLLGQMPVHLLTREVTERCQVTWSTAASWVREADELRSLPHVASVYAEGRLSTDQVDALRVLASPGSDADWIETLRTDLNGDWTIDNLTREARKQKARELTERDGGRFVRARTVDATFTDVLARLYTEEARALLCGLDSRVRKGTHPDAYEAARADALMDLVTGGAGVTAKIL